ncbi:MAG: cyclic nucleotide-gated ion channel, partial [Pseudomonadota bacterium]
YGDVVPVTAAGRFIGAMTMIFGLAVYAIPIGIVASAFSSEIHRRDFVVRYGLVARVPLFEDLAPDVISEISRMLRSISVQAGTVISHRGEVADGLYILVSGEAEAEVAGRRFTIRPGGFFGEISLLRATFREVTVTALTKCRLMLLESRDFRQLLALRPEIRPRLDELVSRHLDAFVESGELTQEEREEILVSHRRRFDGAPRPPIERRALQHAVEDFASSMFGIRRHPRPPED